MRRALLDYDLPPELIAVEPPPERDGARLLVVGDTLEDRRVRELDEIIPAGSLVVVNDTRVIPARLLGQKAGSGGKVELLLLRRTSPTRWEALGRASKPLRPGAVVVFDGPLRATVRGSAGEGGVLEVELASPSGDVDGAIEAVGHIPLPPYMRRPDGPADRIRYQTVFARSPGAVAAPTAGLHLSEALLERLRARGVVIASVTLHVGLGTFQPVTVDDLDDHPMHTEVFSIPKGTADAIAEARGRGAPVIAIGTTSVRSLESAADPEAPGLVRAMEGETRLLIQPGHRFRVVDRLFTNFHLPQSTLLALVAAFAGRERTLEAYAHAVASRYRFFSYGDAMLLQEPCAEARRHVLVPAR